jgi:hypothetical protein
MARTDLARRVDVHTIALFNGGIRMQVFGQPSVPKLGGSSFRADRRNASSPRTQRSRPRFTPCRLRKPRSGCATQAIRFRQQTASLQHLPGSTKLGEHAKANVKFHDKAARPLVRPA